MVSKIPSQPKLGLDKKESDTVPSVYLDIVPCSHSDMAEKKIENEGDVADAIKIGKIFERHEKQEKQGDAVEYVEEKIEVINVEVEDEKDEIDFKVKSNDKYISQNKRRGVCIILGENHFV